MNAPERFAKATATYNYCRICGSRPNTSTDEPNRVMRFWEPDDGWTIGALCRYCAEGYGDAQPHPDDYAYTTTNGACDAEETDEDVLDALFA